MADASKSIKFLYGKKEGISEQITAGAIEGSDFVVTSDTDELVFVDNAKNIKPIKSRTENQYTLVGTDIGALAAGSTIDPGITLDQFIAMICQKRIAATYTKPTVSFSRSSGATAGNHEVGSVLTLTASATFNKNDAGALSSLEILEGSTAVVTGASSPLTLSAHEFSVPEGSVTFSAKATYAQGDVKNDNLGDASPTGRIEAGSVTSSTKLIFTGVRKAFYGVGAGTAPTFDSAAVRSLAGSALNPANNTQLKIALTAGNQYVAFAYPKTLGLVTKVRYEEGNDDGMAPNFTYTEVDVEGANGFTAKTYYVYVYQMATPAEAGMNFTVTI